MRILTAGFDHTRSERLGQALSEAGHSVLSASGAASCRTLASSVTCDLLLAPEGSVGDEALTWAADLLRGVSVVRVGPEDDPVALLDALKGARPDAGQATEEVDEEALVAAISGALDSESAATSTPERRDTEHVSEASILASISDEREALSALPAPPTPPLASTLLANPRRSATLRSAQGVPSLSAKIHDIRFGDYHAILEVQPGASTYVVRQQYDALRELYTPSGWPQALNSADIDALAEIAHGLDDAFSVLGHPTYQSRYEAALEAGSSLRA